MVHLALFTLTCALLLAALSPLVDALPFLTISTRNLDNRQAHFVPDLVDSAQLRRRYLTNLNAPSGFRSSWGIDGYRLSFGSSSGQYIGRSVLSNSDQVDQGAVNSCGAICSRDSRCNFFHPVEITDNTQKDVICALYTAKQNKSAATFSSAPGGGSVVSSYGFSRNAATIDSVTSSSASTSAVKTTTTTSSKTAASTSASTRSTTTTSARTSTQTSGKTTSSTTSRSLSKSSTSSTKTTSASATATATVPPPPPAGATLIQYQACSNVNATIPMLVNKNYPIDGPSTATTVWISQHGSARNFEDYFQSVRNVVGDQGIVIAPNFYAASDRGRSYQKDLNLAWNGNDWADGADAVAPGDPLPCSSYDVYDSLLELLADRTKFPFVNQVFIVAHSGGAAMMTKYSILNPSSGARYVLANAPSMPYFTLARPNSTDNCTTFDNWGYGFSNPKPRYVAAVSDPDREDAFRTWIAQDLTYMTGDLDTYSRDQSGDQTCNVQAQGGQNRRDRGYAWWAFLNLIGGTGTDVSEFYGFDSFKEQNVTSLNPPSFGARHCVVDGVAHDNYGMFASDCGRAAIMGSSSLPPGPGPIRPA